MLSSVSSGDMIGSGLFPFYIIHIYGIEIVFYMGVHKLKYVVLLKLALMCQFHVLRVLLIQLQVWVDSFSIE